MTLRERLAILTEDEVVAAVMQFQQQPHEERLGSDGIALIMGAMAESFERNREETNETEAVFTLAMDSLFIGLTLGMAFQREGVEMVKGNDPIH